MRIRISILVAAILVAISAVIFGAAAPGFTLPASRGSGPTISLKRSRATAADGDPRVAYRGRGPVPVAGPALDFFDR